MARKKVYSAEQWYRRHPRKFDQSKSRDDPCAVPDAYPDTALDGQRRKRCVLTICFFVKATSALATASFSILANDKKLIPGDFRVGKTSTRNAPGTNDVLKLLCSCDI
jgi:hypothetical protein